MPHRLADSIIDLVPVLCAGCGRAGEAVCTGCRADIDFHACPDLPAGARPGIVVGAYAGRLARIIQTLKYGGAHRLARDCAKLLAARVDAEGPAPSSIVPVPTTNARRRDRGFDQVVLLASALAAELGARYVRCLHRRRSAIPQSARSEAARRLIVPADFLTDRAVGGDVLLVDDVITTGSTMCAASGALRSVGADVAFAALAATPLRRSRAEDLRISAGNPR